MSMFQKSRAHPVPVDRMPAKPFILEPGQFNLIDGDTFSVNWFPNNTNLRIRLSKVNTPEVSKAYTRSALEYAGISNYGNGPGARAHLYCEKLLKNKAILVVPDVQHETGNMHDRYNRLLARVYVSAIDGKDFAPRGAIDLEKALVTARQARLLPGQSLGDMTAEQSMQQFSRGGYDFRPESAAVLDGLFDLSNLDKSGPDKGKWLETRAPGNAEHSSRAIEAGNDEEKSNSRYKPGPDIVAEAMAEYERRKKTDLYRDSDSPEP